DLRAQRGAAMVAVEIAKQRRVVYDRMASAERDLSEHGRPRAVRLLPRRRPVVPLAEPAEPLHAELELRAPAVLGLPLVIEAQRVVLGRAIVALQQWIE